MSTIQEELNRLTTARDDIKGVLDRLNVSYEGDKLDMLAKAANTIQKVEATQENGIVTVPAGYISEEQTFVVGSEFSAGYLINNDDGSVYFQKVKVVDGETVNDGDPVQITGVSIPETGVAEPDYAQGGGADVTLGQIDADGNFQPLTFVGTEASNDGSPETVDSYYGWNGTLPSPSGGINVIQGGSMDFYKCASVQEVLVAEAIDVSGAGLESIPATTAVNGTYIETSIVNSTGECVWKHLTSDIYYYYYDGFWCIGYNYNFPYEEAIYYSSDEATWYAGPYYKSDDPPVPVVVKTQVREERGTWTGYKAVLTDGAYAFEETVTTGLTYGDGFIPEVDTVYNSDAMIKSSLWQGLQVAYYVLLDSQKSTAETGQSITEHNGGPTYTTADGVACADFSNGGGLSLPPTSLEGNEVFSVAVKCRITSYNDGKAVFHFGNISGNRDFGIWFYSNRVKLGTTANAGKIIDTGVDLDNDVWYELLVVKQVESLKFYVGNELRDEDTFSLDIDITQNIGIGMYSEYYGISAQVAEVKIYNAVVTPEQVWG